MVKETQEIIDKKHINLVEIEEQNQEFAGMLNSLASESLLRKS